MKTALKSITYIAVLCVLFLTGFSWKDIKAGKLPDPNEVSFLIEANKSPDAPLTPTRLFTQEYDRIRASYDEELDDKELLYAGLDGMMQSLGDPYTTFFEPVVAKEFDDSNNSKTFFGGIGARLWPDPMGVRVIQVFKGSPAEKGGVRSGDVITAVNGKEVSGKSSDDIVDQIKGEVGTPVTIRVFRGQNNSVSLTMNRARIFPPSADGNMIEGTRFGYVLVTGFERLTAQQFAGTLDELESKGMKGLVIDLRNNPGGLLETAQQMLSQYLDYKPVVQIVARNEKQETVLSDGGRVRSNNYPIVILVNENSASAAEIFSGAMQVYRKATLLGEHTYGKASVQNVIPLEGGASAKITIAHYKLPNGADISRTQDEDGIYISGGIKPDVEVALDAGFSVVLGDPKSDNQLQRAIEVLKQKSR